jgi:hypothetical protein
VVDKVPVFVKFISTSLGAEGPPKYTSVEKLGEDDKSMV